MIILNEKEYAEKCIRSATFSKNPYKDLCLIANYYYHNCGYRNKKILSLLTEFMQENSYDYLVNPKMWDEILDKIASKAGKYPMHEIDGVWITARELDTIRGIQNAPLEKLAFTLLCLAKLNNLRSPHNDNWVNCEYTEIFKLARVTCPSQERYLKTGALRKLGLIDGTKKIGSLSLKVLFVDTETTEYSRQNGDLFIYDFRELGYEYMLYKGHDNFIRCADCGILTKSNKNKTKRYCKSCAAYTPQVTKKINCVDCGKSILISSHATKKCRCDICQAKKEKEDTRKRVQKFRQKQNITSANLE